MAAKTDIPNLTIRGRLSFPHFTYAQALEQNKTSKYKKEEKLVRPDFQLLLNRTQLDKVKTYITDVFLPYTLELEKQTGKAGEKSALSAAHVKKLTRFLEEEDWETDPILGLITKVYEKTAEMAPDCIATLKVNGFQGQDLELKAVVRDESELANPTDDIIIPERGLILPVKDTTHELYPGSLCAATINMWAFVSSGTPGITANTSTVVFFGDAERFGGGGSVMDEDDIFMDDDE